MTGLGETELVQWINEQDLMKWAKLLNARTLLADMVADLIRATITDASRYRFPGGSVGQVRGWDGDLETSNAVSFVPAGKSKWEFGVGGAGASKASADYNKRSDPAKTPLEVMRENTLIVVNLGVWDTPKEKLAEWEDERRAEGKWLDVQYFDAVKLVHWLDEYPAVAALYAREVLNSAPKDGALSTDEFWDKYSRQFKHQLHEKVVVADRQDVAEQLLQKLTGPAQSIMIGAETQEEVVAFAVATIRLAKPEVRRSIEVRTLIVETESAARFLSQRRGMIFVTTSGADDMAGVLAEHAPTLSAATGAQVRKPNIAVLKRPTASSMSEGFVAMGLDRQEGYELAHRCGRSLTILRRQFSKGPYPHPQWESNASTLKPAFLAGGWSATTKLDTQILETLSGYTEYSEFERLLQPTLLQPDPPLDRVNEYWQVRAPVDAFSMYGRVLGDEDLERFREAMIRVFSHIVKGPSREEKFSLTYSSPEDYSKWLRDGLALTLLIIATMHEVGGLQLNSTTPQRYVDEILLSLPDWGKSHETLIALNDQMALIAEAAPNPFLRALESMLEGSPDDVANMFSTTDDGFRGSSSPHINVLWALETLAWDPKYLNRAAVVLAKLAGLDPDPNSSIINRPINSLRAILLSWSPNTYAPLEHRIVCLDQILVSCPDVGWQLLLKLIPDSHDTSFPTQMPKLRDTAPMVRENLTFGIVWDSEAAIAKRIMQAAGDAEERIVILAKHFSSFQPQTRSEILTFIEEKLSQQQSAEGRPVWHALREEVARHEYFADSDWAMKKEERDAITTIVERYRPADALVTERQLFDDWTLHMGRYGRDAQSDLDDADTLRKEALNRVLSNEGTAGILRLARMVRVPSLIGPRLRSTSITEEQLFELLKSAVTTAAPGDLAFYVSALGAERFGEHWRKQFKDYLPETIGDPRAIAQLMQGWSLDAATWDFAKSLGDDIYDEYWRQINVLPHDGMMPDLLSAIDELRRVGRSLEVLGLVHLRIKELSSELILLLLTEGQQQIAFGQVKMGAMLSYYLNQTFLLLQKRNDVIEEDIARQEYAYLPLLLHEDRPLALYNFLSSDPAFFVEVLSHVFRGKNAPLDTRPTEQEQARAKISYRLLSSFRSVPGIKGQLIDEGVLNNWVDRVREYAIEADLSEVADQYIGNVLAHAPMNPAEHFWPPAPVCALIERLASKEIETGITIERINMRGVVTRGLYEGGTRERTDALMYRNWAAEVVRYPRTSAILVDISDAWQRRADQEDVSAEIRKMQR